VLLSSWEIFRVHQVLCLSFPIYAIETEWCPFYDILGRVMGSAGYIHFCGHFYGKKMVPVFHQGHFLILRSVHRCADFAKVTKARGLSWINKALPGSYLTSSNNLLCASH
jgi:hypothetical protein